MSKKKKIETALQIYTNEVFGKIRGVLIDGEAWVVGKDVAEKLGYKNPSKALADHVDPEDKLNNETLSSLGQRGGWLINESGLYSLALRSNLESAKPFRRWVTSEVLPSIRKTGAYIADKAYKKWLETREHGKISRRQETDTIKIFIDYARSQGCKWEDWFFYSTISIWCNVGAGIAPKGGRDNADIQQLNTIDLLEGTMVKNILVSSMAEGFHYTRIWAKVQQQINAFIEILSPNPLQLK